MNARDRITALALGQRYLKPMPALWFVEAHNGQVLADRSRQAALEANIEGSLHVVMAAARIVDDHAARTRMVRPGADPACDQDQVP